jgi:hypothetical protein
MAYLEGGYLTGIFRIIRIEKRCNRMDRMGRRKT